MRNAMRGSQFIIVGNSHTEVLERALYFSAHTAARPLLADWCQALARIVQRIGWNSLVVTDSIRIAALLLILKLVFVVVGSDTPTRTFCLNILLPSCTKRCVRGQFNCTCNTQFHFYYANTLTLLKYTLVYVRHGRNANLSEGELEHSCCHDRNKDAQ